MKYSVEFGEEYKHLEVKILGYTVRSDAPENEGGTGIAPSPGKYIMVSIAACTASTAYGYCHKHGLPLPLGVDVDLKHNHDEDIIEKLSFKIKVPENFPENRIKAVERAAGTCWVKKQWLNPPEFVTEVVKEA